MTILYSSKHWNFNHVFVFAVTRWTLAPNHLYFPDTRPNSVTNHWCVKSPSIHTWQEPSLGSGECMLLVKSYIGSASIGPGISSSKRMKGAKWLANIVELITVTCAPSQSIVPEQNWKRRGYQQTPRTAVQWNLRGQETELSPELTLTGKGCWPKEYGRYAAYQSPAWETTNQKDEMLSSPSAREPVTEERYG